MTPNEIARIAHEVNRAYCQALGDHSQPAWEVAPEWQRESVLNGVRLHLSKPEAGPGESHFWWITEKWRDGWCYGTVKDSVAKTHPCMVAFEALPVEQQAKDFIFRAVVHALAPHAEMGAQEACSYCGEIYPKPVSYHHSQKECEATRAAGEVPPLSVLEGDDILSPVGPGPERAEPQAHAKLPNRPVTIVTGSKSTPQ